MKKLLIAFLTLILSFSATFALTACGEDYTYWQISGKQSDDIRLVYVSQLSLGTSTVELTEIWVNVSKLKPATTTLTFVLSNSSTTVKTVNYELTSTALKDAKDGWINVYFGEVVKCSKVTVSAVDEMRINEVVFVKSDATLIVPTFTEGGVKISGSGKSENIYDREKLESLTESDPAYNENPAFNIIDEQDKFPTEYIKTTK